MDADTPFSVSRGTFRGVVQGCDASAAFGEAVSARRAAIARKLDVKLDLVYVESRPVVGYWSPRVQAAQMQGPFDAATDLGGAVSSIGTYHFLHGFLFRCSADVTVRYTRSDVRVCGRLRLFVGGEFSHECFSVML